MASLTVLSGSPTTTASGATFLLTTSSTNASTASAAKTAAAKKSSSRRSRGSTPPRGPSVARRNERERNRVRQVNLGFATLRQHVPNRSKKMSKVETLRSAVQYIRQLQELLGEATSPDDFCGTGDENCGGGMPAFAEVFARGTQPQRSSQGSQHQGQSSGGSPAPSLGSDASSPYDSLSPEDEELIDFTTWLS